jgi:tRNA G37 N-methylase Trm5
MKRSGGILHFYRISEKPNPIEKIIEDLKIKLNDFNWVIAEIENSKIVKSYSPKSELVVIDLDIKPLNSYLGC